MSLEAKTALPEGWHVQKLGDIAEVVSGQSPPGDTYRKKPEGLPFFQGKADFGPRYPVATSWCVDPKKIAQPGDILISVRAPVGPTNVADVECCIGRGLAAIRCNADIDREFLLFALRKFESAIAERGKGSTFDAISRNGLLDLEIPLPPLPEQKRIAAILTEQLAAVERARKASEARLEAARALPAAYLREVFESEEARGWPTKLLGDVSEIASGITLGRRLKEGEMTKLVPYLRVANVKDGRLELEEITSVDATTKEISKWQMHFGDLLLTEGGDPDKLGRGAVWEEQIPGCIHQNHIFRVRFSGDIIDPHFASLQMQARYGKDYFLKHAKQTTGIATINQQVLKAFPLLVPEPSKQKAIAKHVMNRFKQADELVRHITNENLTVVAFPASLLRQAFSGNL